MKKFLLISGLIVGFTFSLIAQESINDLVVVGQVASNENMKQIEARYTGKENTFFVNDSGSNAIEQITTAISGRAFENLHIFVQSTANSLIFNSLVITSENIDQFTTSLLKWKKSFSGKVIIHCASPLSDYSKSRIKQAFERITGMEFMLTI
jgi:hypothetical protein